MNDDVASAPELQRSGRAPWRVLAALVSAFALSQAFRTMPAITAGQIGAEFSLPTRELGLFAGMFHLAFAVMQIPVGVALDRYGPGRTVGVLFIAALAGGLLTALAPNFPLLLAGQALLGIGSSPAFLAPVVFAAHRYPPDRFAAVSGVILGVGGLGMLLTATPLAWVVEHYSWRAAFAILAAGSAAAIMACWALAQEHSAGARGETLLRAFREAAAVFTQRQAAGILILGSATYAVTIAVRSLWIAPLFTERHGFALIEAGHVALAMSVAMLVGPVVFGRLDPGGLRRRTLIVVSALLMAALVAVLARTNAPAVDAVLVTALGALSGFILLQYADVRASYPPAVVGRALGVFNMALFLGVAVVQWASGVIADVAVAHGFGALTGVFTAFAAFLALAAAAFALLPRSPLLK
jgi:predicted MFS family arabinose efflux permease